MKKCVLAISAFLIGVPAAWAGGTGALTLPDAVDQARHGNPEIRKLELAADSASWRKLDALSGHLPHLTLSASHLLQAKYGELNVVFGGAQILFPTAFPQTDIELEASLTIFDGLATINSYRAAVLETEAAEAELRRASFRLERAVRTRFYHALAAQELAGVADENIKTLEQHLSLVRASERAGSGTRVDVLRIESQLEEARAEKILREDDVVLGRRALSELMGTSEDTRPLDGALPVPDERKLEQDLRLDPSRRDDLEALAKRELAQGRADAAAGAFWLPRISVFGSEQLYKYGNFDPAILPSDSFQSAYSVGFKLSWNLFDGGSSIARKAQADDLARQASETTRQLTIVAPNELETWKRRYRYNAVLYRARERSIEKSQESVRLATLAVRAGTQTHSEALDAELDLFRAREGVVRAQVEAAEALANLENALGRGL